MISLPASCQDSEFNLVLDDLILPVLTRFAPEVIVFQGGQMLCGDPLSRLLCPTTHFGGPCARFLNVRIVFS